MARHYTSFLMRLWLLDGGDRRIQIEHIQSGASAQVVTLTDALAWIDVQCADRAEPMRPPDETSPAALPDCTTPTRREPSRQYRRHLVRKRRKR
jgi:hypothetical protein